MTVHFKTKADLYAIRDDLEDGPRRLIPAPVALRVSYWPPIADPDFGEEAMSEYGVPAEQEFTAVAKEFDEELSAIASFLERSGVTPPLADWQKVKVEVPGRTITGHGLYDGLNRRAQALGIWDRFGNPLRFRDHRVYRIWAPADVMGTPMIKSMEVKDFLAFVAVHTAREYGALLDLRKRVKLWRGVAIVLALVLTWAWLA